MREHQTAAVEVVLADLPAEFPASLFIVQHMTPGFTAGLVRWLSGLTRLKVELATEGREAAPGHAYFRPTATTSRSARVGFGCTSHRTPTSPREIGC